jgi:excinuclease ABC subunit C
MDGLFGDFTGFGPSQFRPPRYVPVTGSARARRRGLLRLRVRQGCPQSFGIYGMLDSRGRLIYIGKAKSLRTRLLGYLRKRGRDPKAARVQRHTRTILWETAQDEFGALLRELELIHRWLPRFNVMGKPGNHRTYICLGRSPAGILLSRRPSRHILARYGPVPRGRFARDAVRRLNDHFQLRDCPASQPMRFLDQPELFPAPRAAGCLRHEIGTCRAPCIAACSSGDYAAQVAAAIRFLDGQSTGPIDQLETLMARASARLEFERAATYRDQLLHMRWLGERLAHLRQSRALFDFVYQPTAKSAGNCSQSSECWYLIRAGQVVRVISAPKNGNERQMALEQISRFQKARGGLGHPSLETIFLVAAWFRRHPHERSRTHSPEEALKLLE